MNLPTKRELDAIDMSDIVAKLKRCPEIDFISEPAGVNHYRLLRWFGAIYPGSYISEIGTYMGLGTICLADNTRNKVVTYDVDFSFLKWKQPPSNIEIRPAYGLNSFSNDIISSTIIFVDTFHEGIVERAVYDFLKSKNWKGILIYDDIYYNEPMRKFWESLPEPKIDATNIGHSPGTGIIEFL